jgi:hypothetical protein
MECQTGRKDTRLIPSSASDPFNGIVCSRWELLAAGIDGEKIPDPVDGAEPND